MNKLNNINIPQLNKNEVEKYLSKWDSLENYVLQESALDKLFFIHILIIQT